MLLSALLLLAVIFLIAHVSKQLPLWPAALTFAVFVLVLAAPRYLSFLK